MKKEDIIKILVIIFFISIITTVIPALLSASNDIAVLLGVALVIGVFYIGFSRWEKIHNWFIKK